MSTPNKNANLTDDEAIANLSEAELAIVDATISRAKGEPVTLDVSAYLHENVKPATVSTHAQLARHLIGMKGETRRLLLQNLMGQLLAEMNANPSQA